MKNLILTIAAGLFILTSCSVDEPIETIQDQSLETMYVLNQMDGSSSLEAVASYGSPIENITYDGVPDLPHTEGYFKPPQKDAMSITWDGTQIGNDKSGGAEIKQDALNSSFSFKLVTECVTVDGNEAVYGGIITKAKGVYTKMPDVKEGWRVYFKVFDAGLGLGSSDQISNTIIFVSPKSMSLCDVYLPNDTIWSDKGYSDVNAPGFVVVSE